MTDPVTPDPSTPPVPPVAPAYAPAPVGPKQALSLTSFITGLAGLVFSWVPGLGFLSSLAAIIFGFIGRKKEPAAPRWMSLVGIITGFVGIVLSIILTLALVILPLIFAGAVASVGNNY
jgi:hypothetical protein